MVLNCIFLIINGIEHIFLCWLAILFEEPSVKILYLCFNWTLGKDCKNFKWNLGSLPGIGSYMVNMPVWVVKDLSRNKVMMHWGWTDLFLIRKGSWLDNKIWNNNGFLKLWNEFWRVWMHIYSLKILLSTAHILMHCYPTFI